MLQASSVARTKDLLFFKCWLRLSLTNDGIRTSFKPHLLQGRKTHCFIRDFAPAIDQLWSTAGHCRVKTWLNLFYPFHIVSPLLSAQIWPLTNRNWYFHLFETRSKHDAQKLKCGLKYNIDQTLMTKHVWKMFRIPTIFMLRPSKAFNPILTLLTLFKLHEIRHACRDR